MVSALDAIAVGPYRNLIRQEAAILTSYRGRTGTAAERWIALMTDVDLAALPPVIDHTAYSMVTTSARGSLGWAQAMTSWRQRALPSDRLDRVLGLPAPGEFVGVVPQGAKQLTDERVLAAIAIDQQHAYGFFAERTKIHVLAAPICRPARQ